MFCSFKLLLDAAGFLLAIVYCVRAFINQLLIELPDDSEDVADDIDEEEDEDSDEASADFGE